jgi:hypothetical protein
MALPVSEILIACIDEIIGLLLIIPASAIYAAEPKLA